MAFTRFNRTDKIIIDGKETYGFWSQPIWLKERPNDEDILTYNVGNDVEGRPDLISNEIYNTPFLDWVLIAFNNRFFPTEESKIVLNWPRAGSIIRYPSERLVFPDTL